MKAIVCLMCLVVVAAKPFGKYVLTYDNSFEDGRYDTSLEWMPSAVVSAKSSNSARNPLSYAMMGDSSEEAYLMLGDSSSPMTKSRTQRVQDLTHLLNSGYIDRSDEHQIRRIINNPTAYSNRPYFVDYSGEVHFLAPGAGGAFGGGSFGGGSQAAGGSGVQAAKK